jgi:hypothetical protein
MNTTTVIEIGERLYEEAGVVGVPEGGAAELAVQLHGPRALYRQPRAMAEACDAVIGGKRRIVVREGLPAERANFAIARVLAKLAVETAAWFRGLGDVERDSFLRELAAYLVAPPAAVRAQLAEVGVQLRALAHAFTLTETAVAMRVAEVGAVTGVVVTTPATVYRRGPALAWVRDDDVRKLAAGRAPKSVRRVVLRDEPGRVALLARSA